MHPQESSQDDPFVRLHTLITQLRDLLSLHTKYKCRLSLAEYVQVSDVMCSILYLIETY